MIELEYTWGWQSYEVEGFPEFGCEFVKVTSPATLGNQQNCARFWKPIEVSVLALGGPWAALLWGVALECSLGLTPIKKDRALVPVRECRMPTYNGIEHGILVLPDSINGTMLRAYALFRYFYLDLEGPVATIALAMNGMRYIPCPKVTESIRELGKMLEPYR